MHGGLVEFNGKPLRFTQSQSNVPIGRKSRKTGFWQFDSSCHMWQWRANSIEGKKFSSSKPPPQLKSLSLKNNIRMSHIEKWQSLGEYCVTKKISQSWIAPGFVQRYESKNFFRHILHDRRWVFLSAVGRDSKGDAKCRYKQLVLKFPRSRFRLFFADLYIDSMSCLL